MSKVLLPHPTKGALGDYRVSLPAAERHRILSRLITRLGYASVVRDLNLRATLLKNKSPTSHDIMRRDMLYLHNKYR